MEEHDEEVSLFVSLTGATPETARQYLEAMEWKVQEAFEMYSTVESDPTPRVTSPPRLSGSGAMNDLLSNMEDEAAAFGFPDLNDTPPYQGADPLAAISSMLNDGAQNRFGGLQNEARASQRRMGDTVDPLTGIRAPQAAFRDTLIGPSSGMMMGGLGRGGMASSTDDLEASDWMFAPPDSVKGDIIEARRMAKEQGKWLLVNLQDVEIFESHQLNRDTWKNDTIQALLETSFIFWQRSSTSQAGRDFLRLYGLSADVCLPHIAILGPTGSQLWSRTGFIQPDDLSIALVEFMEANDLNAMTKPKERHFGRAAGGAGSSRSSATYDGSKSRDANDESGERHVFDDDEALQAALAMSLEDDVTEDRSSASEKKSATSSEEAKDHSTEIVPDSLDTQTRHRDWLPSGELSAQSPIEPAPGTLNSTQVRLRLANGTTMVYRFLLDALVQSVYAVVLDKDPEAAERAFTLQTAFPVVQLLPLASKTLAEAGLSNTSIVMRWC